MKSFQHIVVIYNPNSTGNSEKLAKQFVLRASKTWPKAKTTISPTKRAGHAEEIAASASKKPGQVLVVSSSGDGGYSEVVNGVMKSGQADRVTCAVLPAGNANDHSRTMHQSPLIDRLKDAKQIRIDLLKADIMHKSTSKMRYAHSYIGLGLTSEVGRELNKHDLTPVNEKIMAAKTLGKLKPFKILRAGKKRSYQSLIFSNINNMAKVLTFSGNDLPTDGKFEVTAFRGKSKIALLVKVVKAALWFVRAQKHTERYEFTTLHNMSMQLDGEIIDLPQGAEVTISIAPRALSTLI
ncbi:MAG: diacylglycerol kinase [bacterium]|nr:diacylglycerol kinase [bacterium]